MLQELPSGRPPLDSSTGIAPEDLARRLGLGPHVMEAWGGPARFITLPLYEPLLLSRVNPDAPPDNPFIAWGLELGLTDILTLALVRAPDAVSSVGVGCHRDAGPVGDGDLELARLLAPHLKRAILISRLLEARTLATTAYASVLDGLSVAVLLLGPELRLVLANRAGVALLRTGDPLALRHGRLSGPAGVIHALGAALAAPRGATGPRPRHASGAQISVTRASGATSPGMLR